MPYLPSFMAVSAGFVALAMVGHVWMFDAHSPHEPVDAPVATTVAAPQAPLSMSECSTGMSACEVPMPTDPLALVLVTGLMAAVLSRGLGVEDDRAAPDGAGMPTDRAPPPRLPRASSVVLLV